MRYLKYLALAGLTAALLMTGCGTSEKNQVSSDYESSVDAEIPDADGSEDSFVEDDSWQLRQNASAGSLDTFDGKYQVKDAEGVWYYFGGDGICYYVQQGTYSFSRDINADGVEADMIAMQFDTMSVPTYYTLEEEEGELTLRTTYSGAESETIISFECLKGSDGILEMEPFEGIYSAYGMDSYRYEFHSDGTFYLILEESYVIEGDTVTLSAFGTDITYDYEAGEGSMVLSSEDTVIANLVPGE